MQCAAIRRSGRSRGWEAMFRNRAAYTGTQAPPTYQSCDVAARHCRVRGLPEKQTQQDFLCKGIGVRGGQGLASLKSARQANSSWAGVETAIQRQNFLFRETSVLLLRRFQLIELCPPRLWRGTSFPSSQLTVDVNYIYQMPSQQHLD